MYDEGDVDSGVIACSQAIGIVREIKPVAQVIDEMIQEAARIQKQLGA
jgi:NAD(P)H-dependent flavin oxidoreductase YrpB (nitropropane dioxygenase family)